MSNEPDTFSAKGGAWVVVQSVLMLAVILLGVLFPGDWTQLPVIALGAVLFAVGGWCGIAGVKVLGRNRTPFPQPLGDSRMIQHGIYSRMRHPLYTSVMLASLGWALIWQSAASFAVALLLVPFFQAKSRREEQWLIEKFPDYRDYARRVPRFLPRPGKPANLVCNF
jgi:protein-S-isoprenylcysteine O-methyltransferase Ste14